jgi:DNA repair protein RecN (Recombination protein N)
MLTEIHIENFAIIDRLDLDFRPGLITFTGETGAGKSIIIDAVESLLGGRADANLVRAGADRALVEGIFHLPLAARGPIEAILTREGLLEEEDSAVNRDYLTLGREIRLNGRNIARVNGRSVSASLLRELGEYLIDLHGQSDHLSLLRISSHLGLLDSYVIAADHAVAPLPVLLRAYREVYDRLQGIGREIEALRQSERDSARRADMLAFQIQEIEGARLRPTEEEELREERNRLANAEGLASLAQAALLALDEGSPESPAGTDLIGQVVHAISGLARLDPSQEPLLEQAQTAFDVLSDLSHSLHAFVEGIEFNPKRLDQVEERLGLIAGLKRKYGDSIPAILAFGEEAQRAHDAITHAGERLEELGAARESALQELGQVGEQISQQRRQAAAQISQAIEGELADLHMSGARFTVAFQQEESPQGAPLADGRRVTFHARGLERVEFMIAPNPGEGFKPLAKVASGGETSRLMLALKNVLAQADQVPTLIFDEIDQGIGGRVGGIVGQKLWNLAREHQVLCITHLPQLAAYGEQHLHVRKHVEAGRTTTRVDQLEGEARYLELAQMLGEVSEGTLRSAHDLVQSAAQHR